MGDAGDDPSTMHSLKAIEAAGTDEARAVVAKMREMPVNDFFATNGEIRVDDRFVHDMHVWRVETPERSTGEPDLYEPVRTIPAAEAFPPLSKSKCRLVNAG